MRHTLLEWRDGMNFGTRVFEEYDYRMAQIAPDAAVAVQPAVAGKGASLSLKIERGCWLRVVVPIMLV